MQPKHKKTYEKFYICVTGSTWVAGLLIAGCDSPYMPWVNGVGLILFFCSSVLLGKHFRKFEAGNGCNIPPTESQKQFVQPRLPEKRLKHIHLPMVSISKCRNLLCN